MPRKLKSQRMPAPVAPPPMITTWVDPISFPFAPAAGTSHQETRDKAHACFLCKRGACAPDDIDLRKKQGWNPTAAHKARWPRTSDQQGSSAATECVATKATGCESYAGSVDAHPSDERSTGAHGYKCFVRWMLFQKERSPDIDKKILREHGNNRTAATLNAGPSRRNGTCP